VYIDGSSTDYNASLNLDTYIKNISGVDNFVLTLTVEQRRTDIAPLNVSARWQLVRFFHFISS
jgi:hypothetical protein